MSSTKLKILVFGQLEEAVGQKVIEMEPVTDTSELKRQLYRQFPALGSEVFRMAVNADIISSDIPLPSGATIALLPPFSGG
ncbi:MAG: MoaD/ThiS family protein [Sphingobacteriales bacterium]|nr:MAG: MoaD/ThiS family protein [Sphingobacteriales bacterium]